MRLEEKGVKGRGEDEERMRKGEKERGKAARGAADSAPMLRPWADCRRFAN